jgi:putative ABC transport system substrate-binding protein
VNRREFIAALGGAATGPLAAWPLAARAQQRDVPVIGFLNGQSASAFSHLATAFRMGLAEEGYVQDRNVTIEYRWAEGRVDVLGSFAAELIRRSVNVIVATGGAHAAAKAATASIPIVFTTPGEPVKEGLVASLNRPGGNATGVSVFSTTLEAKRLELLHELLPRATKIGVLIDPNFWTANLTLPELHTAANVLGISLQILNVSSDREVRERFASLSRMGIEAVVVAAGPFLNSARHMITELMTRSALPSVYEAREFAAAGGLMSYGPSIPDVYRWVGIYAGRILNGTKPADLPVVQPTKLHLVINLKTAKALGIDVSSALLARADEVIE